MRVDGNIVGVTPLEVPMSSAEGMHTVAVENEGFVVFTRDLRIKRDAQEHVEANLRPSEDYASSHRASAHLWRIGAWTAVGIGAVAVGGGVAGLVAHSSKASEYETEKEAYNAEAIRTEQDRERLLAFGEAVDTYNTLLTTSTVVAALAGIVAAAIFMFGPDPSRYQAQSHSSTNTDFGSLGFSLSPTAFSLSIHH